VDSDKVLESLHKAAEHESVIEEGEIDDDTRRDKWSAVLKQYACKSQPHFLFYVVCNRKRVRVGAMYLLIFS